MNLASETLEGAALADACKVDALIAALVSAGRERVLSLAELSEYEHASTSIKPSEWYIVSGEQDRMDLVQLQRLFVVQWETRTHVIGSANQWNVALHVSEGGVLRVPRSLYLPEHFHVRFIDFSMIEMCTHVDLAIVGDECVLQKTFL
jgi:hypothetical protein